MLKKEKEAAMLNRAGELINDDYHSFLLVSLKLLVSGSPAVVINGDLPIVSLIRFLNLLMSGTAQEMATAAIVCSEVARDAPETFRRVLATYNFTFSAASLALLDQGFTEAVGE